METPRIRARASLYRRNRRRPPLRPLLALGLVAILLVSGGLAVTRVMGFLQTTVNLSNPLAEAGRSVDPPPGSLGWKVRHGQQVNLLLLGYGGAENDAPWLTDSMMVVSLDPANRRALEVSIPRDLEVQIDAWPNHRPLSEKINAAYAVGMDDTTYTGKRPEFTKVKTRGGRLAEQTVSSVTGLQFDGYVGVDFKAFRDLVNALGGAQVCLDEPLDDNEYPDYHDGYVRGGIHFKAGCQQVDGEKALQLARSRHAIQPNQASDFGRARRQQVLLNSIRKKATSVNAITRAPELMNALQKDFDTDLGLADLKALYDWSAKLPDGAIGRAAISASDFMDEYYQSSRTCGDMSAYTLCPEDPTFRMLKTYFANLFVDPNVLKEAAPIQVANASRSLEEMGSRVSQSLSPLGLKVMPPVRARTTEKSVIYDYSRGKYPLTTQWLARYFNATVVTPAASAPAPTPSPPSDGVTVVLGRDYALRWIGQA